MLSCAVQCIVAKKALSRKGADQYNANLALKVRHQLKDAINIKPKVIRHRTQATGILKCLLRRSTPSWAA